MDVYDILRHIILRLFSAEERRELLEELEKARKGVQEKSEEETPKKATTHGTSK